MPVQFEDFFDDIPYAAFASVEGGNIAGQGFYLRGSIGRTSRQATQLHHRIVGNVVAHVQSSSWVGSIFFKQLA